MSGLQEEFPQRVVSHNVDASLEESVRDIKSLGFKSHGLVIRSSDGTVLWKQPDHQVDMVQVREAIEKLLAESG